MAKLKKTKPQAKAAKPAKPKAQKSSASSSVKKAAPKAKATAKPSAGNHSGNSAKAKPVEKASTPAKLTPFLKEQQKRLLNLRDSMLDSMAGVAKDNLRSRAEGSEASAFGMHQADAGSDAYDRDFALNLLSKNSGIVYTMLLM